MIFTATASLDPAAISVAWEQIFAKRPSLTLFLISMGFFTAAAVLRRVKRSKPLREEQKIPAVPALGGSSFDA